MKKITCLLAAIVLVLTFAACGNGGETSTSQSGFSASVSADGSADASASASSSAPSSAETQIGVAINGSSTVKSGRSETFTATVTGTDNSEVVWSITTGGEYAQISDGGVLTADAVDGDKTVVIRATSKADSTKYAEKTLLIVARQPLTDAMLEVLATANKLSFDGMLTFDVYTIGTFPRHEGTTNLAPITTRLDGEHWYATYQNSLTNTVSELYYANVGGIASQVGVSFMNEEYYYPMLDDFGDEVSWEESGFYNNFVGLKASDFTFNDDSWEWEYSGGDGALLKKLVSSANPYDFEPASMSLIISGGEILGLNLISGDDFLINPGFRTIQTLTTTIDYGENVEMPTVSLYSHDAVHDDLQTAIDNMKSLTSYKTSFKQTSINYMGAYIYYGYEEIVTPDLISIREMDVNEAQTEYGYTGVSYGYKKISDDLYNAFYVTDGVAEATRAYAGDFSNARPGFNFAAEIFRSYYVEDDGSTTYYVDAPMAAVATEFYKSVGSDYPLFGIFAAEWTANDDMSPYVTVKDGYIVEAGFYYSMGYIMSGIIQLDFSDFNAATAPEGSFEFAPRQVPTSWSEILITDRMGEEEADVAADEFLAGFLNGAELPFFGDALGDTFGFCITSIYTTPHGGSVHALNFYYDVPLDLDYTVTTSEIAFNKLLVSSGFTRDSRGVFVKNGVCVYLDEQYVYENLDFTFYVWYDAARA